MASANSGLSIDDQLRHCSEYVRRYLKGSFPVGTSYPEENPVGVFFDRAVSAWSKKIGVRPGGHAMLSALKPGGHVVIYSIDRGFRNMADFAVTISEWDRLGITPHFVEEGIDGSSAYGRFFLHVRAAAAQCFSDLISHRIRESNLIRKRNRNGVTKSNSIKRETIKSSFKYLNRKPVLDTSNAPGRIWRYERCSTQQQYISGLGLEVQSQANLEHAEYLRTQNPNLEIVDACVDEAVSAYTVPFKKRPQGKRIWEEAKAGDHVVVYRLDRAWRSVGDAVRTIEEFLERGVHLHFVCERIDTTNETGLQTLHLLSWAASMESKLKSRRLKSISQALRAEGRGFGQVPKYAKAIKFKGKRKIVNDMRSIRMFAMAWVARCIMGVGYNQAKRICIAYHCAESGLSPKRAFWPDNFRDESWTSVVVKMFPDLKGTLPVKSWQAIAWQAVVRLQAALPPQYVKYLNPTDTMFSKLRLDPPPFTIDLEKAEQMIGCPAPDIARIGKATSGSKVSRG